MANQRFRSRVEGLIAEAIRVHAEARSESHPGLAGLSREIAVEMLLRPLLPPDIAIGTGKIVDSYGGESTQLDVILHHAGILPAAMYGDRFGLFPIEACLYVIEVKSTATARGAAEVRHAAQALAALRPEPGVVGIPAASDAGIMIHPRETSAAFFPNFSYFAFSTDLATEATPSCELDRVLPAGASHHDLHLVSLCVAGSVTSSWSREKGEWVHLRASPNHDEVVYFISTMLNTISKMRVCRPFPNIGRYLWDR